MTSMGFVLCVGCCSVGKGQEMWEVLRHPHTGSNSCSLLYICFQRDKLNHEVILLRANTQYYWLNITSSYAADVNIHKHRDRKKTPDLYYFLSSSYESQQYKVCAPLKYYSCFGSTPEWPVNVLRKSVQQKKDTQTADMKDYPFFLLFIDTY